MFQYRVYISYLEIYNEAGYDLLGSGEGGSVAGGVRRIEHLPRVVLREDEV